MKIVRAKSSPSGSDEDKGKSRQREMSPAQVRTYMEMAVQIMQQSVAEPREDGKASPKVGAVLVKPDGTFTTACRGELRDGDHAEFTLLERKHRSEKLDGSVLFATLEPCGPGARNAPKIECAKRIVLARIKKVWVGIGDPDPTVDRKGIAFLQKNGVEVSIFDRDLQEIIREENREFLRQADERAAAANKEEPEEVELSPLERPIAHAILNDFDPTALEIFRSRAKIRDRIASDGFSRHLAQIGLLKRDGPRLVPSGFGLLLFGRKPRAAMPQAGLLATIHYPDGKEEIQDFDGPQVFVVGEALRWLRDKLPNVIDRSHARRQVVDEALFEVVREGVVNAIVHRDYGITGAKSQLVVTPDTIEIRSPGKPVRPLTLEQMRSFDAPMLSRNPILHYVFAKMELAEERGLGLKSIRRLSEQRSVPLPTYLWQDPYLVLRLYRSAEAGTAALPDSILNKLSQAERAGWQWLTSRGRAKSTEYANANRIEERTARRHLNRFVDLGLAARVGSARSTLYRVKTSDPDSMRT